MDMSLRIAFLVLPTIACVGTTASGNPRSNGSSDHVMAIPLGHYANCIGAASLYEHTATSGGSGSLTLEQNGSTLKATLGAPGLLASGAIAFNEMTPTTAVVASGQTLSVVGPDTSQATASPTVAMTISTGTLTFIGRTVALSLLGSPQEASYFLTCDAANIAPASVAPSPPSQGFAGLGVFGACSYAISLQNGGLLGGGGSVTLRDTIAGVTADVRDIPALGTVSGSLAFATTSDTIAHLLAGQNPAFGSCPLPGGGGTGPMPLANALGALVNQGNSVFINIVGATSCAAQSLTAIACRR